MLVVWLVVDHVPRKAGGFGAAVGIPEHPAQDTYKTRMVHTNNTRSKDGKTTPF